MKKKVLCLCLMVNFAKTYAVGLDFTGELIDSPCQINPSDLTQTINFLERPAKDFWYSPGKGENQDINIKLSNCEESMFGKIVSVSFSGITESAMGEMEPFFLAVAPGPLQGKLAIGILNSDGITPLKIGSINNGNKGTKIDRKDILLNFKAYVQATPDAIVNQSINEGDYSATVKFSLNYN
ncbi:fimbrial protein [Vibrio sp.]|uniref:fimbrial protein n=1 Tax=Vibrio sp. TaxID=678 RepID=UPI003AA899D5